MKQTNEKKQDLLLDALSCIDEDILERGLALRDGTAAPASKAAESAPKTPRPATVIPPLYDLTRQPDKPPKKNPWRVLAVVAAACLLLCAVPLSMWVVGSMTKNEAGENAPIDGTHENNAGIQNGTNVEDWIPGAPGDGWEEDDAPEAEAPDAPMEEPTAGAIEEATEAPEDVIESITEPETVFEPEELIWNTVSKTDGTAEYTATGHNGAAITLLGTRNASLGSSFPAEDEMALRMVGQWLASLYTLDYGDHFPLFYESFVQEMFFKEAVRYGQNYTGAIDRMYSVAARLFPVENVTLTLSLEENALLAGEELAAYLATKPAFETARGFDPESITAVRRVRVSGSIETDGFHHNTTDIWPEPFYLYEYEGKWYLDETLMDDDLSIDLLGTGKADTGFYKLQTTAGIVVAVDDIYLYLDTGDAYCIDGATVQNQTDGGEWQETVIRVGDIVSVSHYSFELEGLTRSVDGTENEEWTLSTATEINYYGRAVIRT